MTDNYESSWPYWSVDIPGLTEAQANELLALAGRSGLTVGGSAVDPALFLTVHLDKETVAAVENVLSEALIANPLNMKTATMVAGVSEILQEWIAQSA